MLFHVKHALKRLEASVFALDPAPTEPAPKHTITIRPQDPPTDSLAVTPLFHVKHTPIDSSVPRFTRHNSRSSLTSPLDVKHDGLSARNVAIPTAVPPEDPN